MNEDRGVGGRRARGQAAARSEGATACCNPRGLTNVELTQIIEGY